eukprot:EG_transcript_936
MRLSVYTLYVGACLLAVVAAILSGVILLDTFAGQQRQSEDAQLTAGRGQVHAIQGVIGNQMQRMMTLAEEHTRSVLLYVQTFPNDTLQPENVITALNQTLFPIWAPAIKANHSLNGYGLTLMYTNETTGALFDRTIWAFWEMLRTGELAYTWGWTFPQDGLLHAYPMRWPNFGTVNLGPEMYTVNVLELLAPLYQNNDYFWNALPWAALDGNSYWYFIYMRAFQYNGIWFNLQSWDVDLTWLSLMKSGLTAGASVIAFDSQGFVMTSTNADEQARLAKCLNDGILGADCIASGCTCISIPAKNHPIAEIRNVYNALHTPEWDELGAGPIPLQQAELQLSGERYLAIVATLFSKDRFRITVVWYQPWVNTGANSVGLTALICILTMLSTFVLTLLGVFGVLRPLMALGSTMRAVAQTLKEGDGDGEETVLEPRKPNVFREVDAIGQDFETIVVDFLGFSSSKARDNRFAPKDPQVPFAVIFTDIQSSTGLWVKDPAEMSRCVQAHHQLIRGLISQHQLYEVKTAGDSFMVTTTSAADALAFALDLQQALYEYEWDWDECDDFYRETTLAFTHSPGTSVSDENYRELWDGLRVRVGIHHGRGEVTFDEVSKGYDYYGAVVNAAARIEALGHGGQVVVSEALLRALPAPLDLSRGLAIPLGAVPLRGVAEPPKLFEVKPAALLGRTFPPLRVERANVDLKMEIPAVERIFSDAMGLEGNPGLHRCASKSRPLDDGEPLAHAAQDLAQSHVMVRSGALPCDVMAQYLLVLYRVVEDLLTPLAPSQFATVTKALAKGWGVAPPKTKADFGPAGLWLMQRMSETTKVLGYLAQLHDLAPRVTHRLSQATEAGVLEAESHGH